MVKPAEGHKAESTGKADDPDSEEKALNLVDMVPKKIEVEQAKHWKGKDLSHVRDFKHVEVISDWTFSTPYKGTVKHLSRHLQRIKNETDLALPKPPEGAKSEIKVEPTD